MKGKTPQGRILSTYYMIVGLFTLSASLIWGINTLFLLGAGMSLFEVFAVNAIFSASMAVFEIPTGVLADTLGRRLSFLLSAAVLMLGTLGYVLGTTIINPFWFFAIMSIILGLAFTFYSGAVEAWIVDAMRFQGYTDKMDLIFSKAAGISNTAMLIGSVLGGLLGTLDLRIPYLVRATIILAVFLIAWRRMQDLGYKTHPLKSGDIPAEMSKIARASIQYGLKNHTVRQLMWISFIFSSFMMWGWYAWQPYFLGLFGNREAVWLAGIIAALFSLSQVIGNIASVTLLKVFKQRLRLLTFAFTLQALAIVGVGLIQSFYPAVGFFLCFSFAVGLAMPVKQAWLHEIIPSEQRASIVSFDSLVGSVGSVGGQVGYGYLADRLSISAGYIAGGLVNLMILIPLFALRKEDSLNANK